MLQWLKTMSSITVNVTLPTNRAQLCDKQIYKNGYVFQHSCLHLADHQPEIKTIVLCNKIVLLRIPSSRPSPRTFPQFVQVQVLGFLVAENDGFET